MSAIHFKQARARGSHLLAANDARAPADSPCMADLYEAATEDETPKHFTESEWAREQQRRAVEAQINRGVV